MVQPKITTYTLGLATVVIYHIGKPSLISKLYTPALCIYMINKMKKEVGMLLQKRADTSAVGIYKLYEENTH